MQRDGDGVEVIERTGRAVALGIFVIAGNPIGPGFARAANVDGCCVSMGNPEKLVALACVLVRLAAVLYTASAKVCPAHKECGKTAVIRPEMGLVSAVFFY